jgi:adenine-specific DNA-methyltransferase
MPRESRKTHKRRIERYEHMDKKRVNNPPVGLVTPETDPPEPTQKSYEHRLPVPSVRSRRDLDYDPHLDPQLVWAGKKEQTSFEVPTVSLHVHERIDPRTIIEAVRKRNGNGQPVQASLFERPEEKLPLRDAIDFYKHAHGWSNRMIAGDSLLVMNSLLEKEGMGGQVQMVYVDPPYGIKYGSNFQPFVNKRDVKDGKDEDLTQEPEMIRAFRDTWELDIHSYLTYLRDRLLLARDLLAPSGSIFVQISDENLHHVREVMDESIGAENFIVVICYKRLGMMVGEILKSSAHYLLWYARDIERVKFRKVFEEQVAGLGTGDHYNQLENLSTGEIRPMSKEERGNVPAGWRAFQLISLQTYGLGSTGKDAFSFEGQEFKPGPNKAWRTTLEGLGQLADASRLHVAKNTIRYKQYLSDFPFVEVRSIWENTGRDPENLYVVQTPTSVVERCILMTTEPGDLVLDPTCGSGTTAYVAEQWGRRWITCDTSRVSITLAKQRLMTSLYDYYELAHPEEGVGSGFQYRTVPHITLKSIANNPEIRESMTREQTEAAIVKYADQETLYDQPYVDSSKARVSGPFTLEAVPAPTVRSLEEIETNRADPLPADSSIARKGATLRHTEWRDELLKTGIRGKGGQTIHFSRVEPLAGTRWVHADGETKGEKQERVVIAFGPEHGPLEQRQVEMAWEEARTLIPKPSIIVFAAFQFDPEAAKDIDELTKEKTGMTFLTAQMNADLLTEDLKKKRASNQSFWLVGRPDVETRRIKKGVHREKWEVEVRGFDYYNTRTGAIESGDASKIAMWLLDTDYDGRNLYPRQVFFPMADDDGGWARLARNLKAEIDQELVEAYRGTVSLPFERGPNKRVAVKVIDDRGLESLKVVDIR